MIARLPLALLLVFASLLTACGDGKDSKGSSSRTRGQRAPYVYNGPADEWDSQAVPGAPAQIKPIYTAHQRPAATNAASLSPTVYYVPKIDASAAAASPCPKYALGNGWNICSASLEDCLLQGSCFVSLGAGWRFFTSNVASRTLKERQGLRCRFGAGSHACLSPYASVAADLAHHQPGDVIYVPSLDGKRVPYLGTHDGFFVVHDKGGAIKGAHRFDFFTGHQGVRDPDNALARWGFGDKARSFAYVKLPRAEAEQVKREKGLQ